MNPETKNCQNCKKEFTVEPEDFNFYEKMKVPAPTWCPECRMIRRFHFRNEGMLFRRKDSHTGKEIFSGFSPDADVITYENNYWFGGDWDQMKTGVDYDFSRPFFTQFKELLSRAPLPTRSVMNMINSDYCNEMSESRNSYLCFNCDYIENSGYLRKITYTKDSFDMYEGTEDELCYEGVMVDKSYRTFFSIDCESCVDVWFSKALRGCTNCFGCVNLINKSHYFFNQPYSREEYAKKMEEFISGSNIAIKNMWNRAKAFWLQFPVKYAHNLRIVNSTGERIFNSKNVKDCYSVRGGENMRYCQDIQAKASNSYDYLVWGAGAENMYECVTCGMGCYNLRFCFTCWPESRDSEYCIYSMSSNNCFGCVGLYKKEYCIFNKQYGKEEYFELVSKIKEHMKEMPYTDNKGRICSYGEFFPYDISPIAYNESMAQDFFPVDADIARENGFIWRDTNRREFETTIDAKDLPDNIKDSSDKITEEVIKCESCSKAYRITKMEFQFYKRIPLPLPRLCHNCRFVQRFKFVNPPSLWHKQCMCKKTGHSHEGNCLNEFKTPYAPDRPEIIFCEKCYQQEFA